MKPGDKLGRLVPYVEGLTPKALPATVVWVHPLGRFCVVEFVTETGMRFRESFPPEVIS
jgi:hypothetical protein